MNLLLLNYVMDSDHPVLSHQLKLANSLSKSFENVYVLTGRVGNVEISDNMILFNTNWVEGSHFKNIFNFYRKFFYINRKYDYEVVYSHMTLYQSLLIAPFTIAKKLQHYLWYAHKSRPFFLNIIYPLISGIITSTHGSFPFPGKKVNVIGQGIDFSLFPALKDRDYSKLNFVHFGRIDESKGIHEILDLLMSLKQKLPNINLTFIGGPARPESIFYKETLLNFIEKNQISSWVKFMNPIPRNELAEVLSQYNIFIHNFQGSLDKTLLEATALLLDVITINKEYIKIFGSWKSDSHTSLALELDGFLKSDLKFKEEKRIMRKTILEKEHSYENWIKRTVEILQS